MVNSNDTAMNANAFASTFYFFADTQGNAKKIKRACKPTHPTVQGFVRTSNCGAMNVECFGQPVSELQTVVLRGNSTAAGNIRLKEILKRRALFGNQTVVLLTNSCGNTNSGASNPFF